MAGLEPLAALSLACNVFQIVGIGREIIALSRQVFRKGSIDSNVILADKAALLDNIATDVHLSCSAPVNNVTQPGFEKNLLEACQKCQTTSRALVKEVSRLTGPTAGGSRVTAVKIGIKSVWNKRQLKALEEDLQAVESLMNTGLMAQILSKIDSANIQLDSLNQSYQKFVHEYKTGQRNLANLVSLEAVAVRGAVSAESQRSEIRVKQHITQETSRSSHELAVQITGVAGESTRQVLDGVENFYSDAALEAKRDRVLQSLSFPEMNGRKNGIDPEHSSTLQWILDEEERPVTSWDSFPGWLCSDSKVYWISGKPGAGKSTLINYLLHNPETQRLLDLGRPDTLLAAHFFWRVGSGMQQSLKGLLCSLVFQLLEQDARCFVYLMKQTPGISAKRSDSDWSVPELRRSLLALLNEYSRPVCAFLDGVDEVNSSDEQFAVLDLINELGHVPGLKLCVSSRPEPMLKKRLGQFPQLKVQDLNHNDLYTYAHDHLGVDSTTIPGSPLDSSLVLDLVKKAEGVFLWIRLAVTSIKRGMEHGTLITRQDFAERIGILPLSIESMCEDMWARLGDDRQVYRERAAFYLSVVLETFLDPYLQRHVPVTPLHLLLASKPDLIPGSGLLEPDEQLKATMELLRENLKWLRSDVEATCVGFIELRARASHQWVIPWKGDCPFLSDVGGSTLFQFGHRCFLDFFVESTSAQAILAHAQLSIFQLWIRTLKARAAACSLFFFFPDRHSPLSYERASPSSLMRCLDLLNHTPAQDAPAGDELGITPPTNRELQQVFQSLQQLFHSRRLYAMFSWDISNVEAFKLQRDFIPRRFFRGREEFLMLAAARGDARVIGCVMEELKARRISRSDLSQFLLDTVATLLWRPRRPPAPAPNGNESKARRDLVKLLLDAGADPNAARPFPFDSSAGRRPSTWELWPVVTPLARLLKHAVPQKAHQYSDERVLHTLGTIASLLEHGACPQDLVFFHLPKKHSDSQLFSSPFGRREMINAQDFHAAFAVPAKLILDTVLDHCRSYRARLRGSSELEKLEKIVLRLPKIEPRHSPILVNSHVIDMETAPTCLEITNQKDREFVFERITRVLVKAFVRESSQEVNEAGAQLHEAFRDVSIRGTDTGKTMDTKLIKLGLVVRAEDVVDLRT
ncbi:hypothetical protein RB595_004084 [Gaeumannomyces hyphopodioides]